MAFPIVDEITTTALRNRRKKRAENVSKNNALLFRLKQNGKMKLKSGGRTILEELNYQENQTFKRYSGYETLNIAPSQTISAAEYEWKQAAVAISMSGLEMLQNAGPEQIIDLLEARIENGEQTLMNNIASDIYSLGTADGGKQIDGLQQQIADAPTSGIVGGINRATYSFWQNYKFSATADGSGAVTATNIETYMNDVYASVCRGTDKTDLIVSDKNYWKFYLAAQQNKIRYAAEDLADAGFETIKFFGADVVLDGGVSGACPSNHMYFLNTKNLSFVTHKERNFVPLNPDRFATNQDAMVKLIAWAGNLTLRNAFLQGVLIA